MIRKLNNDIHLTRILYFLPHFSTLFLSYARGFPLSTASFPLFFSSSLPRVVSPIPYYPSYLIQRLLHRYLSLTSSAVSC